MFCGASLCTLRGTLRESHSAQQPTGLTPSARGSGPTPRVGMVDVQKNIDNGTTAMSVAIGQISSGLYTGKAGLERC